MNNPFFYEPDALCLMAAEQVKGLVAQYETWREEVAQGKMFGVLVVERPTPHGAELGYLAAFSGQLGGKATWEGFVPPVFDYLQPDGYFKIHEREISEINAQLSEMERNPLLNELKLRINHEQETAETELKAYRKMMVEAKKEREDKRKRGATAEEQAVMVAESQFQKAELRRLKQRIKAQIECLQAELNVQEKAMTDLKSNACRMRYNAGFSNSLKCLMRVANAATCSTFSPQRPNEHHLPARANVAHQSCCSMLSLWVIVRLAWPSFGWGGRPKPK